MRRFPTLLSDLLLYFENEVFLRLPTLLAIKVGRRLFQSKHSDNKKSILVIRLDGIGDCVMSLVMLEQLRTRFPDAFITVVVQQAPALLLADSPFVDEIIVWTPHRFSRVFRHVADLYLAVRLYFRLLRNRTFDIVINPRWDADTMPTTLLCALTKATVKIGYEDATSTHKLKWNRNFQNAYSIVLEAGPPQHEVLRDLAVGQILGCSSDGLQPRLNLTMNEREEARSWLENSSICPRIAIGLPAAAVKRRWSAAKYNSVFRLLSARAQFSLVLFADEGTEHLADSIKQAFPDAQIARKIALKQVAAILGECQIFLGSDSGLAHIAAAVGCKTIILSPHPQTADPNHHNSPFRFRPYARHSLALQPELARQGCEAGCISDEAHCILDIDPQRVFETLISLLEMAE